jgi:hypothetical protein
MADDCFLNGMKFVLIYCTYTFIFSLKLFSNLNVFRKNVDHSIKASTNGAFLIEFAALVEFLQFS